MSKLAITRDSNYRNYPLLDYDGPGRGFYTAILDRLIDRLEYQLAAHGKVLMIRLVAKYPDEVDAEKSNQCFQYFMEEYRRKLMIHDFSPQYVWVREQHTSKNPHYHFVLFLNANRIQYFNRLREVRWLWVKAICKFNPGAQATISSHLIHKDQSVYHSQQINHGLIVTRNNRALQEEAIRFCSYIAKINTKEATPFNCNCFHASQLPENRKV